MTELLRLDGISRRYGGLRAVDDVTLSIEEGSSVGLIGPNGAGKTTLFGIVAGAIRPSSGRITFAGRDITRRPAFARSRMGIVRSFQNLGLMFEETVATNVAACMHASAGYRSPDAVLRPWRVRQAERRVHQRAAEWMQDLGVEDEAGRRVSELSFGLARRTELAGIFAMEPRVLLLDEPTAGLSVEASHDLLRSLRHAQERYGVTVLLIGHDVAFVMGFATTVHAMAEGRVVASGTPDEVRRNPDVVAAYLGERQPPAMGEGAPRSPR